MTADVDLARLLGAVERAGAKMIVVGDDRQLDAVGPGGALTALTARHREQVWTLSDNLRQSEPGERAALAHLRDGNVAVAVGWYARAGRVHPVAGRGRAVNAMVKAWAKDTGAGRETLMLAYRRDNVEALNQTARRLWEQAGLLSGPELVAPGGRRYRAGDRIITLAPGPGGAWVTSQAAHVTAVDPHTQQLTAVTPDGQQLTMGPDDIGFDRLGHGYAITAHRSQGSTVDVAHVLDDGGGRELAYVAMSRARTASHIYVTALDPDHAAQRLTWGWDQQRRQPWITHRHHLAARTAELIAQRDRLAASIPPDVTDQLTRLRHQIAHIEADRADLHAGTGRWAHTPVGQAQRALQDAQRSHDHELARAHDPHLGLWVRHRARKAEQTSNINVTQAETVWLETIRPHDDRLDMQKDRLVSEARTLEAGQQTRTEFLAAHPDIVDRISQLDHSITQQQRLQARQARLPVDTPTPALQPRLRHDPHLEYLPHQQTAQAVHAPQIGGPGI